MGHPAPFNMHFIGIGNEQWGPQYIERYQLMASAVQKAHPEIKIVGSVGPSADGDQFNYLWGEMKKLKPALVDEHYYMSPEWFLQNARRYDNYNRSDPKIFAGEYAAQSNYTCSPDNKSNWKCALAEAAFMTGLERNADVVYMASYAPLFGHLDAWQWAPNLIWFDNICTFPTVNYQVQKLFSTNKGTTLIPATINKQTVAGENGLYISSVLDEKERVVIVKVVNANSESKQLKIKIDGIKLKNAPVEVQSLQCDDLNVENFPGSKKPILPKNSNVDAKSSAFIANLDKYSVNVYRLKY